MPNQKESNIDQNNMKENISSSSGEIVFSSLKTIEDGPANGKNLYAFGDGNGSWINILKQLYSRGIIKYQHGDKAFQQEISSFELAEQNVLDEFQRYAINNKATQIPPTLGNFYENQVFSYLDNLDAFFKKFTCQKVSGDPVDVILIGDLLNDRFTNNYGMISLLAAFGSEINFKVIFSNHDFHAINQFKVLRNGIDQYKNNGQHSKENPAYIENFIFKPLLNEINRMVGSFAVKDNAGSVLASGVHFGLSSITWFFTLKHLVGKEKTIQPLEHFLNMVDKHYYPIVELALGRSYKTNEEEKYAVFTHAPSMFTIPNLSSLNEDAVKELCIKLLNEDQQLGGSFINLYLKGVTKNNFTINVAKNILDNIATYPITGLFNYMQNKFSANIDEFSVEKKKSLVESVNALKSAYESSLSTYNNSINKEAMRKSLVRSIVDIISLMSDLKNLYLQNNLIEDLLTDYEILKFTQNRVLYKM